MPAHSCTHSQTHTKCMPTYVHSHMYKLKHAHIYICILTHTQEHAHASICTSTQIAMHSHTQWGLHFLTSNRMQPSATLAFLHVCGMLAAENDYLDNFLCGQ